MPSLNRSVVVHTAPVAAGSDFSTTVAEAVAGTVSAVTIIPDATITGAATNNRTIQLVNKKQDGTGTTVIASINFVNGTNAAAFDSKNLTLSATASDLVVADGDVLALVSTHVGTGVADPGVLAKVTIARS